MTMVEKRSEVHKNDMWVQEVGNVKRKYQPWTSQIVPQTEEHVSAWAEPTISDSSNGRCRVLLDQFLSSENVAEPINRKTQYWAPSYASLHKGIGKEQIKFM
jgi:hypothetical protein